MSLALTIAGSSVLTRLERPSLQWETAKTGSPDMLIFSLTSVTADALAVAIDAEVIFSIGGTEKFRGRVIRKGITVEAKDIIHWNIECQDYSRDASKGELIAEIYENQTVNAIITALLAGYSQLSTFTMTHVSCTEVIDYLFLDHVRFPQVLKTLADRVGYECYIDKDKDIHFFLPGSELAAISVTDTNGNMQRESFSYSEDGAEIVNSITMEGGEYDASTTESESFSATGGQSVFNLSGRYSQVTVTVNAVAQTVGVYGLNDAVGFDCLHDFSGKRIVFTVPLIAADAVVVSGKQKLPIIIQIDDSDSVTTHGSFGMFEKDASLKTIDSAVQYASALLDKFGDGENAASFVTNQNNLRAGQKIRITHSEIGLNADFYIQRTRARWFAGDVFLTQVDCAKAEIVDAVGTLARMLNKQNQSATAAAVLNIYRRFRDACGVADVVENAENKRSRGYSDPILIPLLRTRSAPPASTGRLPLSSNL